MYAALMREVLLPGLESFQPWIEARVIVLASDRRLYFANLKLGILLRPYLPPPAGVKKSLAVQL
jgi:hypothetical protein